MDKHFKEFLDYGAPRYCAIHYGEKQMRNTNNYCNQRSSKTCTACLNCKCEYNKNPVVNLLNQSMELLSDNYDKNNSPEFESILNKYLQMN